MAAAGTVAYVALAFVTTQNVLISVTVRYAALAPGPSYSVLAAVVVSEVIKFVASALIVLIGDGSAALGECFKRMVWTEVGLTVKMGVPGACYLVQNWFYFVGCSQLSISLFTVTKQTSILMTALLWFLAFGRHLGRDRWLSLLALTFGVVLSCLDGDIVVKGSFALGMATTLFGCFLSALGCVWLESLLKGGSSSIWECNMRLAVFGVFFGVAMLAVSRSDREAILERGLLHNFGGAVWATVLLQSVGGLATATVLKYLDSVTKCVSKAAAVVAGAMTSRLFFGEGPALQSERLWASVGLTVCGGLVYGLGFEGLSALMLASPKVQASDPVDPETVGVLEDIGNDQACCSETGGEAVCETGGINVSPHRASTTAEAGDDSV